MQGWLTCRAVMDKATPAELGDLMPKAPDRTWRYIGLALGTRATGGTR